MLEHPVDMAAEKELEEKLEALYPELVRKLTGGRASHGGGGRAAEAGSASAGAVAGAAAFEEALAPIRAMLQADGADLAVSSLEDGTVHLRLVFSEGACRECVLPREELTRMIVAACRERGREVADVVLRDPREED